MKRIHKGFTLIELLIVVAIIAVLVSLLAPAGNMLFRAADNAKCQSQLKAIAQAYLAYTNEDRLGHFPPFTDKQEFSNGTYRLSNHYSNINYLIANGGSFEGGFGPLVWGEYVRQENLVCPKDVDRLGSTTEWWSQNGGNPMVVKRQIEEGGSFSGNIESSYSLRCYLYPWTPATVTEGVNISLESGATLYDGPVKAFIACRIATVQDVLLRHENGAPVAYLDGSVKFRQDPILWDDNLNKMTDQPTGANRMFMMTVWQTLDKN